MLDSDPSRSNLHQHYEDLLPAGQDDAALTRLVHDLDAMMNTPTPASLQQRIGQLLLEEAAARYHTQNERTPVNVSSIRRHSRPTLLGKGSTMKQLWVRRPLMTAALVLLALLVFSGGAAFAFGGTTITLPGGLRFILITPREAASQLQYTRLDLTHPVGNMQVTLTRAAFTKKNLTIDYTYATQTPSTQDGTVCALSLTSSEGDTFTQVAGATPPTGDTSSTSRRNHGSGQLFFAPEHLNSTQQSRDLHLLLQLCGSSTSSTHAVAPVAFDFALPLQ